MKKPLTLTFTFLMIASGDAWCQTGKNSLDASTLVVLAFSLTVLFALTFILLGKVLLIKREYFRSIPENQLKHLLSDLDEQTVDTLLELRNKSRKLVVSPTGKAAALFI